MKDGYPWKTERSFQARGREDVLDKEHYNILIFGSKTSKTRHLKVHKKTFKIALYLLAFALLSTTFFFCDYIQVKKKAFELARLRQETQTQKSQIHFFSAKIEDLEKQLSRLKDFDKKIRILANLERGEETNSLMGMGGPSPSDIRDKLKKEKDDRGLVQQMRADVDRIQSEALSQEVSLSELEKQLQTKKEILIHTPSIWPIMGWVTSGFGFRTNPFTGLTQMHEGLDISNRVGTSHRGPCRRNRFRCGEGFGSRKYPGCFPRIWNDFPFQSPEQGPGENRTEGKTGR